jgi:hypothetical protein
VSRLPFPNAPGACPDETLLLRWELLFERSPRLRPWLGEMLVRQRVSLEQRLEGLALERALWDQLARWLLQFESLPGYAIAAITTVLQDEETRAPAPEPDELQPPDASPEHALGELETLLGDPAFALALHCVDARLRPRLAGLPPSLSRIPEQAWFGLLQASAPKGPLLTADVAVSLVLRLSSPGFQSLPGAARAAALRLFQAGPSDLRAAAVLERLCAALPPAWGLNAPAAADFVAAAAAAKVGLIEACALAGRIAAAIRGPRCGGLASLVQQDPPASKATAAELAELARAARRAASNTGFSRLLSLL